MSKKSLNASLFAWWSCVSQANGRIHGPDKWFIIHLSNKWARNIFSALWLSVIKNYIFYRMCSCKIRKHHYSFFFVLQCKNWYLTFIGIGKISTVLSRSFFNLLPGDIFQHRIRLILQFQVSKFLVILKCHLVHCCIAVVEVQFMIYVFNNSMRYSRYNFTANRHVIMCNG